MKRPNAEAIADRLVDEVERCAGPFDAILNAINEAGIIADDVPPHGPARDQLIDGTWRNFLGYLISSRAIATAITAAVADHADARLRESASKTAAAVGTSLMRALADSPDLYSMIEEAYPKISELGDSDAAERTSARTLWRWAT